MSTHEKQPLSDQTLTLAEIWEAIKDLPVANQVMERIIHKAQHRRQLHLFEGE